RTRCKREQPSHNGSEQPHNDRSGGATLLCAHGISSPCRRMLINVLMIVNPFLHGDRSATVKHIGRRPDPCPASRPSVPQGGLRTPWGLAIIPAAVLGLHPCSEAHALLERSTPENGAALARAPGDVLLVFTEQPEPALSSMQVLDASGRQVAAGAPQP